MKHVFTSTFYKILVLIFLVNMAPRMLYAQILQLSGIIKDSDNQPIPGANIVVKKTGKGTISDFEGNYAIKVEKGDVISFSFVGMQTVEKKFNGQSTLDLVLEADAIGIEEIQIVGYGVQRKVTVTGAISSISSKELLQSPSGSVSNALTGKVTGISTVQYSGQPGADEAEIYVRGIGTLDQSNATPLMIVDGVERSFTQIDPEEIESITVLKDASATAVYGVRGANGVIIVTTKRGETGKTRISVNMSGGVQTPTRLLDFTDSNTYAQMFNEAQQNDGVLAEDLRFQDEALEAFRTGSDPIIYPNMDWLGYILKPYASQNKENINISGGTNKVKYFFSLGHLHQDGLFETFEKDYDYNFAFNRYNYRSNLDIDVTKTTKLGLTIGGRTEVRNEPLTKDGMGNFFRNIYWSVPFSGAGIVDGKYILSGDEYISDAKKDALDPFYGRGYQAINKNTLNFDIDLKQNLDFLTEGLNFRAKVSYNTSYTHTKKRASSAANYQPYYLSDIDDTADPDDKTIVYRKSNDDGVLNYNESYGKARDWYAEAGITYKRSFGAHNVGGLVLYNQKKTFYPSVYSYIPTGYVGLVGRVTYNYNTKYMFDVNLGYNGSENFAEDQRFGFFPAFSAGWIISEESFMDGLGFIEYLKLRGSYGLVGNDRMRGRRFLYLPDSYTLGGGIYNFGTDVPSKLPGASEGAVSNQDVTWETAKKQNYGIDLGLLGGDLFIYFDYFKEHRNDILTVRQTVPDFIAVSLPVVNIGEVENEGFELSIKLKQKIANFSYWIRPNISYAVNKIVYMDEVDPNEPYLARTGYPVNQPFGYLYDGFFSDADFVDDGSGTGNVMLNPELPDPMYDAKPGDVKYKDLNDDGFIDDDDQQAIGFPNYPQYSFGTNLGFSWKFIDFNMTWAGALNTSRLLDETYRIAFGPTGNRSLLQYMADERWTPETAASATYPRMTLTGIVNNSKDSDLWLRDASYIRLKNIELGFNLRSAMLKQYGVKSLRIYFNGYNLLTFDRLKITDPESRTGSDSMYPVMKIFNAGVKINF